MDTLQRIEGAMVGLAIGEGIGGCVCDAEIPRRVPVVIEEPLRWRDGTQLAVYLGIGLLRVSPSETRAAAYREQLAAALRAMTNDPSMMGRASSTTTLSGIFHLTLGDDEGASSTFSDGGTAALRGIPVGCVFSPQRVWTPARVAASLLHRHPTAVEAAVVVAWLVSMMVRGVPLSPHLLQAAVVLVRKLGLGGSMERSLRDVQAAYARYRRAAPRVVQAGDVFPGDGGFRSGSLVGLAMLASMLAGPAGPESWEDAVISAARVQGDGHQVAGLCGSFLGAAWGFPALPVTLVDKLEDRDHLIDVARALHLRAEGLEAAWAPVVDEVRRLGWTGDPPGIHDARWAEEPDNDGTESEWELGG